MAKKLIIIVITLLLFIAVGWLLWGRGAPTTPGENPLGTSPFGTPTEGTAGIPATQPDFIGEVAPLVAPLAGSEAEQPRLFKLAGSPVAGFVAFARGSTTIVRYADRGTGHIFETKLPEVQETRLTNETMPQIYEAYFRQDGTAVLYRTLDDSDTIRNLALSLTPPRGTSTDSLYTVSVTALRGQIDSITRGQGDALTYVLKDARSIVTSRFNGEGARTLWSGPFTSWRTGRLGTSGTLVFTKPSASMPGYSYDISSGSLAKLIGPLNGLTAIANPAGTYLLYSYSNGGVTKLAAKGARTGVTGELSPATIAVDKCVGSSREATTFFCGAPTQGISGSEPDLWYQGKTHFSDDIWSFDAVSQGATLLVQPESEFGIALDVFTPAFSPDEQYLVFINKNDLSLWALSLR